MNPEEVAFVEADFHARQRDRLCNPRMMPPLTGPWAEALGLALQNKLRTCFQMPVSERAVVDCFATAPTQQTEVLFWAIKSACVKSSNMTDADVRWATELTTYAVFRTLDVKLWSELDSRAGSASRLHARVNYVPTNSSLIAALGLAQLTGRVIRLGKDGQPRGVIDISSAVATTNPVQQLLTAIYDYRFAEQQRQADSLRVLTDGELAKLVNDFRALRLDDEFVAAFIVLPPVSKNQHRQFEDELADKLNLPVVHLAEQDNDLFVEVASQFNFVQLKDEVEKIFRLLPYFEPSESPGTGKSASRTAESSPRVASTPSSAYTWDVFISHASEDKAAFVNQLVEALKASSVKVWYDAHELKVGDSLRAQIDKGLAQSRFGIVVLSPNYFAKNWAQGELDALLSSQLSNGVTRALPVWLDLDLAAVQAKSPLLADKVATDANQGLPTVVAKLLAAITRSQ
jgi:hypothetical protein